MLLKQGGVGRGQRWEQARCAPLPGQVMKNHLCPSCCRQKHSSSGEGTAGVCLLGSGIAWQCLPPEDGALSPKNRTDAHTQTPPVEPSLPAAASVAILAPAVEPGALLPVAHKDRAFFPPSGFPEIAFVSSVCLDLCGVQMLLKIILPHAKITSSLIIFSFVDGAPIKR